MLILYFNLSNYVFLFGLSYIIKGEEVELAVANGTFTNSGRLESEGDLSVRSNGDLVNEGGTLKSGGNMDLESEAGDIDIIGSDVSAAGRGDLTSGGSVNVFGVNNTRHTIESRMSESSGFLSKTVTSEYDEVYDSTVRKGSLSFGEEDSSITAVENINLVGSDLTVAGQTLDLDEDGNDSSVFRMTAKDVNVVAMEDEHYEKHESKSTTSLDLNGWDNVLNYTGVGILVNAVTGGLFTDGMVLDGEAEGSETSQTTTVTTYKGSGITVGGDLDADISGVAHLEGSTIVADGDVDVNAVGGITAKEVKAKVETETKRTDQRLTTTARTFGFYASLSNEIKSETDKTNQVN